MGRIYKQFIRSVLSEAKKKSAPVAEPGSTPVTDAAPSQYKTKKGTTRWKATRDGETEYFDTQPQAQQWYSQSTPTSVKTPSQDKGVRAPQPQKASTVGKPVQQPRNSNTTKPTVKGLVDMGASIEDLVKLSMPSEIFKDINTQEVKVAEILGENYSQLILSKDDIRNKRDAFFAQQGIEEKIDSFIQKKIESLRASGVVVDEKKEKAKHRRELALFVESFYKKRNYNIRLLERIQRGFFGATASKSVRIKQFAGKEGTQQVATALKSMLKDIVDEAFIDALVKTPRNKSEIFKNVNQIFKQLKAVTSQSGKSLDALIPYVAENISLLLTCAQGGTGMLPIVMKTDESTGNLVESGESFPLADVLALQKNIFTNDVQVDQIIVDTNDIVSAGDILISVKSGDEAGAAASNEEKYLNASFFSRSKGLWREKNKNKLSDAEKAEYANEGEGVRQDLLYLVSSELKNEIFSSDDMDGSKTKEKILEYLDHYREALTGYYFETKGKRVPENEWLTKEELYDMLSSGREPECSDDGKPQKNSTRRITTNPETNPVNYRQWENWSVVNFMQAAIHNRYVDIQAYSTHKYGNTSFDTADGYAYISGLVPDIKKSARKLKNGSYGARQKAVATSISVPRNKIRFYGNPCVD